VLRSYVRVPPGEDAPAAWGGLVSKHLLRAMGCGVLVLACGAAFASVVPRRVSRFDRAAVPDPAWRIGVAAETPDALPGYDAERAGWAAFKSAHGDAWSVWIDRRSGAPLLVEGQGIPWFAPGATFSIAQAEAKAHDLVRSNESLFKIHDAQLVLSHEGSAAVDGDHAILLFERVVDGVKVDGQQLILDITRGNLTAFGANAWGTIDKAPAVVVDEATARQLLYTHMGILSGDAVRDLVRPERLLVAVTSAPRENGPYLGAVGAGTQFRSVWRFVVQVADEPGTWAGKVDTGTGEIVSLVDDNKYAQAKGGVYPVSDDQQCPDGCEQQNWPMPYADVTINGTPQTAGDMGIFDCSPTGGTAVTHLAGPYVRVADVCGQVTESITCDNDLDLRSGTGTDCAVPAGSSPGNTHSARTGFYHLNRVAERGRYWLPSNTWLQQQLTDNIDLDQTCNAYWNGSSVNFFKSGGGCNNTGEIAGVFLHEWGHGLDENDGGGYDDPTEAYADINALLSTHVSCVGRGFYQSGNCSGYGDACLNCSGIRDQDWNMHVSHTPATPQGFVTSDCGGGDSPCGREQHCETYVSAEAIFDFATRDLTSAGLDLNTAWELTNRLWYESRQGSGGNAYNCSLPSSDGCGAGSWFTKMRNIDDDDGNLSNGTPHAAAIFAAFNRHNIACGAASDASNQNHSSCPSFTTPVLSTSAGSGSASLSWSPVSGASSYLVLRNDAGCSSEQTVIATVPAPGTTYTDTDLPNGFTTYYTIQAQGSNNACGSALSNCVGVTPQPFAGTVKFDKPSYSCSSTIQVSVLDANIGASTTTATVSSTSEPSPETLILTETPPGSGKYIGTITATSGPSTTGDGLLRLSDGDLLSADYIDADDGQGGTNVPRHTTAVADCRAPAISGIAASGVTDTQATVGWNTDEASTSVLHWGGTKPPSTTTSNFSLVSQHAIGLSGLQQCTVYWYSVESQDASGNSGIDDHSGTYYSFETLGNFGQGLQPCHAGKLTLSASVVGCSSSFSIKVIDIDLNQDPTVAETVAVTVSSGTEPYGETVVLTETGPNTSQFVGSISTSPGPAVAGDGILQTQNGEPLTGTYHDADNGTGSPAVSFQTATADCAAPGYLSVQVTNVTDTGAIVQWTTSEPSTGKVDWGTTPALGTTVTDNTLGTSHQATLSTIAECARFYFRVTSTDAYGNTRVADQAGAPFEANAYTIPSFFRDDFESSTGWTLGGEWQIAAPQGKGSGTPDPSTAYAGSKVLGHDLTGLGTYPGDYEPNKTEDAISPVINASAHSHVQLKFRRWLNVGGGAYSLIDVKKNGVWNNVFITSLLGNTESAWTLQTVDISAFADGNATLQIRFEQNGGISQNAHRSGWNVDRFIVHDGNTPDFDACGSCGGAPTFGGLVSANDISGCADTGIQLTWNAAPAWGTGHAGSYSVYRDTNPTFTPSAANRIATGLTGTSYTDASAPNAVDLYYIVRAENDETCSNGPKNNGVTDSNLVRVRARDEISQPSPGDVGATLLASPVNAAHVRLTWTPPPTAAGFQVYRSQSPSGGFGVIASPTGGTYDDVNAMGDSANYYYLVRATDSCGNQGP
jgi:fibronectin type 3 domain-containing protein